MSVTRLIVETAKDYRQRSTSLDALIGKAEQARSGMNIFGMALAREIGGEFNLAANKDYKRAKQKVDNKYNGDASRLTDLVRGRIFVDDVESIIRAREILNPKADNVVFKGHRSFLADWATVCANGNGYFVQDFDDKHAQPTEFGWRDISVRVRVPLAKTLGHTGEIQILHRDMAEADKLSHPIYECQRRMLEVFQASGREMTQEDAILLEDMSARRLAIHNEAAEKAGLTVLEQPKLI
ncbi:MAG: hypothetical protein DI586_07925 [Micavibrio aeruginosavorus]|uniref:RelA/SpoT domain-containing protein n=1 Tax=Micavibrio aeruginosavorus TaxID=349221 RepID=A0A2W5FIJ9_9BACT|nr:MAG: hypothetical protein DI586_07925 [Micavibrio aeruginosavorus]